MPERSGPRTESQGDEQYRVVRGGGNEQVAEPHREQTPSQEQPALAGEHVDDKPAAHREQSTGPLTHGRERANR